MFIEYGGLNHLTFLFQVLLLSELLISVNWTVNYIIIESTLSEGFFLHGNSAVEYRLIEEIFEILELIIMEFFVKCLRDGWNVY